MAKQDFYEVLGASKDASKDDLKKAYRKLAMQYHPDRNPDDAESERKFKELNEAYDVLKDDQKRAAYDRFGHAAFEGGGAPGGGGPGFEGFGGGFADIFEEMFGDFMGGRRGAQGRGSDLRYNMGISLEDAFNGNQTEIRVPTSVQCEGCNGTGAESGSKPISCPSCQGRGKIRAQQGFFTIERTCPSCGGQGQVIENPCKICSGAGRQRKEKTLSVNIPAGVEEGTRIRLAGEGEAGMRGAPPGDLYLFISIQPHPLFQREGADIYCGVPVPMATAALGGVIEVPTIEGGRARVQIPEGSQSGRQFRLKSKGMSILRSPSRGDMYVEISVETPMNLTKKQRELLEEFRREGGDQTNPRSQSFFDKVKEFLDDLTD
jgi:molecular chaperone DnaJ